MLLGQVAEGYHNYRRKDFSNSWKYAKLFNKKLNKYVVKKDTNDHQQKISEQLNPAFQGRTWKHNIPVQ